MHERVARSECATYMLAVDALALGLLRVTELLALRPDRSDGAGFIQKGHHSLAAETVSAQKKRPKRTE